MTTPKPVLAIIGGAGHQAAARLHQALLDRFSSFAVHDRHYPDLLVLNRSIDGVGLKGVEDAKLADACLSSRMEQARAAGATHCILACASLHTLPATNQCLDWMGSGARRLASAKVYRVGVLASSSARTSRLFEDLLTPYAITVVHNSDQDRVDHLIAQCLSGTLSPSTRSDFLDLHASLRAQCDRVWRACTELSAIPASESDFPDLCSLDLMVEAGLRVLETKA